ncbi:hypothetical protein GGR51DRAFT_564293 [Nemania sp. FL0031]|nr:hypothetical protein GGR51DRAFT_564293 [Nemania sp. FL0031]
MQFSYILLSLLSTSSAAFAIPVPISPSDLHKRAVTVEGFPPGGWTCVTNEKRNTKTKIPANYIEASVDEGIRRRDEGDPAGKYPQYLTNPESISGLECYAGATNIDHYPLNFNNLQIFSGGSPTSGARVFYVYDQGSDTAKFLGLWTHAGRKDGTFIQCTPDSS